MLADPARIAELGLVEHGEPRRDHEVDLLVLRRHRARAELERAAQQAVGLAAQRGGLAAQRVAHLGRACGPTARSVSMRRHAIELALIEIASASITRR